MTDRPEETVVFATPQQSRLTMYKNTLDRIKELQEAADQLKSEIIADLGASETAIDPAGQVLVTYKRTRKFDIKAATQRLTVEQLAACTVTSFDPKLVKAKLTGEDLDACMVPSTTRTFSIK